MPLDRGRFRAAMIAGSVAIVLNSLVLKATDLVPLATALVGLLRLIRPLFPRPCVSKPVLPPSRPVSTLSSGC